MIWSKLNVEIRSQCPQRNWEEMGSYPPCCLDVSSCLRKELLRFKLEKSIQIFISQRSREIIYNNKRPGASRQEEEPLKLGV
jgi:hypothetical protein